ncbi:hypothetical protein [Sporosarcina ureilytica]|uniref:Uncharacterized protein n=1 Tax=Sporosarcina ureilytica TaxID=298596 RepID=A0A1D8JH24_9BACL|nr:hypothetical protein [Sporosarcina ureilytica]AOV07993.1 hypothetical protein BI350_10905 [Sporosarcina ureilytica]
MESKMIDFGYATMPVGFSKCLSNCFYNVTIDIYATPDFTERYISMFLSEDDYILVTARRKEHINYRELGQFELLDAIFSEGDYFHSFLIAKNMFYDERGSLVKLIALLYEERGNIHIWNPTFEELFLPLIQDDLDKGSDSHWQSLQEIQQNHSTDLDIYDVVLTNQVDYEIEVEWDKGEVFTTVVYYALLKHIFLVEDEKYPEIPGSKRTIQAYKELFDDHLNRRVDMDRWRKKYRLKDPRRR